VLPRESFGALSKEDARPARSKETSHNGRAVRLAQTIRLLLGPVVKLRWQASSS
jgi:hypothetical protein